MSLTIAKTVTATFTLTHLCVDAASGSDTNAGTCTAPLKTITKALALVPAGGTVLVRPGTYSVATNGETFPIAVPADITLVGDEPNKGNGAAPVFVNGEGLAITDPNGNHATLVAGRSSTVAGLKIGTPHQGPGGILIEPSSNSVTIRNNTIDGIGGYCIVIKSSTNLTIVGNMLANAGIGIGSNDSAGKVEGNIITGNDWGVSLGGTTNGLDLGGGSFGSLGGNTLSCNTQTDVAGYEIPGTFSARGNKWDHATPTSAVDCLLQGYNKDYCGSATLDFAGATLASAPCPP